MKLSVVKIYILLSLLLIADLIAEIFFKISLAGYWSDRVLFWIWFIFTIYIVFAYWTKRWTKIYFSVLIAGIVLSMLPMGIIFLGILTSITGKGLIYKKELTNNYRFQITAYGIMSRPINEIIENKGLFEKEIANEPSDFEINDSTSISNKSIKDVTLLKEDQDYIYIKGTDGKLSTVKKFKKIKD